MLPGVRVFEVFGRPTVNARIQVTIRGMSEPLDTVAKMTELPRCNRKSTLDTPASAMPTIARLLFTSAASLSKSEKKRGYPRRAIAHSGAEPSEAEALASRGSEVIACWCA